MIRDLKAFVQSGDLATSQLSGGTIRVLMVLWACRDSKTGEVKMSQRDIADMAGVHRRTVRDCIDTLIARRIIASDVKRGAVATYRLGVPAAQHWASGPAQLTDEPVDNMRSHAAQSIGDMGSDTAQLPPNIGSPPAQSLNPAPARVLDTPNGRHHLDPFARKAIDQLRRDRKLPLSVAELMEYAYRIGDGGDPWDGYTRVKQATEASLTGSTHPAAVTRARLKALLPE